MYIVEFKFYIAFSDQVSIGFDSFNQRYSTIYKLSVIKIALKIGNNESLL